MHACFPRTNAHLRACCDHRLPKLIVGAVHKSHAHYSCVCVCLCVRVRVCVTCHTQSSEMEQSTLDLILAGTRDAVLMIEGFCDLLSEEDMLKVSHTRIHTRTYMQDMYTCAHTGHACAHMWHVLAQTVWYICDISACIVSLLYRTVPYCVALCCVVYCRPSV